MFAFNGRIHSTFAHLLSASCWKGLNHTFMLGEKEPERKEKKIFFLRRRKRIHNRPSKKKEMNTGGGVGGRAGEGARENQP